MANSNINDILYDMFGSDNEGGSQDETIREGICLFLKTHSHIIDY